MAKVPDLEKRRRDVEIAKSLSLSTAVEADQIKELIKLRYERAKENLVTLSDSDMLRAQGEAQCLKRLHQDLTRKPQQE